ncbi:sensor domain-containing diguanylate cyclase [Novosphingobium sp. M1R2S20]|uniref:diguanylate cyclase n=1 Tax=Novosphingobium rhizovicinum TaxID=3228928 RepID=A0ABV3RDG5_9SPHN
MHRDFGLSDESARIAALHRLAILDTGPEEPFENIVALVRSVLGVPIAVVSLLDEDRQWFKARSGLDATETARDVSFCTHAIAQREPLVISDATKDARFCNNPLVLGDPGLRAYAGVPLTTSEGYNVGSLCAVDTAVRDFSPADVAMLSKFARVVVDQLELRRVAARDQLTGTLTRRGFIERANQEIERFRRYGRAASLALIDIDHFKAINDTHGHPAGDAVLREVAGLLHTGIRPNDVLGRIGGEEFALLMPETEAEGAVIAVERLREEVAAASLQAEPGLCLKVTASFGIAELDPAIVDAESWFAATDVMLYAAKRSGRNRCVVAPATSRLSRT